MTQLQLDGIKQIQITSDDITEQLWINLTPAIESLFELELRDFIAAVNNDQISYKEAFTTIYNLYTLKFKMQLMYINSMKFR